MELTNVESAHMTNAICNIPELFFSVISITNTPLSYETKCDMIKQYASEIKIPATFLKATDQGQLYGIVDAISDSEITTATIDNLGFTLRLNKQFVTPAMIELLYGMPNDIDKFLLIVLHGCITACGVNLNTELEKYDNEKLAEMLATNSKSTIKEALIAYEIAVITANRAS